MRAPLGTMMLDDGAFMPSLAALDVIVSAATPAPIVDEGAKKLAAANAVTAAESVGIPTKAVPQAAVPIVTDAQKDAAMGVVRPPITVAPVVDELTKKTAAENNAKRSAMAEKAAAADKEADAIAAAELKAKQEAEAKAAAELKAKQEAEAKAAAELKAKQEADAKAAADAAANKPDPTKTAYADLTPAQRAAMTQNERLDYLQAARDFKFETEAAARGASNPMFNYAVRPAAPQVPGMIQYYSWIGGRTTGEWRLYGAVDNDANRALYGARAFAGETQATPQSITGANSLKNQPVWDPATNSWKPAGTAVGTVSTTTSTTATTTTTTASTSATNTDYTTVNGILNFKGAPFNGTYNGTEYVNGVPKQGIANDADYSTVNGVLMYKGAAYTGDYQNKKYVNGKLVSSEGTGVNFSGSGTTLDPFMESGKPFTGTKFGSTYTNGVIVNMAQKTADDIAKQGRLDARTEFGNTLKALGLPQDLIDEIDTMIKQDYTNSQMYLELQKTTAWKNRFPGMAALAAAGKAIDAGTYISQEKSMLQTLDYYGIDKNIFGTTAELGKQIANMVSPKRFETVVALAAQDVENNPDVLAGLNLYYGVDKSAAISYLLNPTIGLDLIQRQARAAEIGAKAAKSNFAFGMNKAGSGVAESFINAAGTMDLQALDVTFQQARGLADTQSSIAATEGAAYNDLSAVSAILGKDQAAILDSQRRAARSVARFSGRSGLGSGSLASESSI